MRAYLYHHGLEITDDLKPNFPNGLSINGVAVPVAKGNTWYVDPTASSGGDGKSWESPLATIAAALALASDGDTIYLTGDLVESVTVPVTATGPNYIHLIGVGSGKGVANETTWTSAAATDPCLLLQSAGWTIENIKFICPVTDAAIVLALSATANASYTTIRGCTFDGLGLGLQGIDFAGAPYHVTVENCLFHDIRNVGTTSRAITCSSSATAIMTKCRFINNVFLECNGFIDFSVKGANDCVFVGNVFQGAGKTITAAPKLDLGAVATTEGNTIAHNTFGGAFTVANYRGSAGSDTWIDNGVPDEFIVVKTVTKIAIVTAGVDLTGTASGAVELVNASVQNDSTPSGGAVGGVLLVTDDTIPLNKFVVAQGSDMGASGFVSIPLNVPVASGKKVSAKAVTGDVTGAGNWTFYLTFKRINGSKIVAA